jgi:hypothetical protein
LPRAATEELVREAMSQAHRLGGVTVLGPGPELTVEEAQELARVLRATTPGYECVRIWVGRGLLHIAGS